MLPSCRRLCKERSPGHLQAMRSHLVVAVLALAGGHGLLAQDRPAEIVTATSLRYPEVMRAAGIRGTVRVEVEVLAGDSIASDGIRIVSTPHPGFVAAVTEGLRGWRYRSARRAGQEVTDTLQIELTFESGGSEFLDFGPAIARDLGRDKEGRWHALITPLLVREGGAPFSGARRDSAALTAARYLARGLEKGPGGGDRIACVTLRAGPGEDPLTATELAALQSPGVAVVHPGRCPPKFASMVYMVGRVTPPGSDPAPIVARGATRYPEGWVVIRMDVGGDGAGYDAYDCILAETTLDQVGSCKLRYGVVY